MSSEEAKAPAVVADDRRIAVSSPPAPVAVDPRDPQVVVDKLNEAIADAERLQRSATRLRADGEVDVTDPQAYAAATHLKVDASRSLYKVLQDAYGLKAVKRFFELVLEELEREDPDLARRVSARIRAVANQIIGAKPAAKPR